MVLCISSLLGLAAVAAAPDVLHSAASVVLPGWLGASLRPGNGTQAAGWRWQYGSPRPLAETLELIKEENTWKNSLVLGWLEPQVRDRIPRLAQVGARRAGGHAELQLCVSPGAYGVPAQGQRRVAARRPAAGPCVARPPAPPRRAPGPPRTRPPAPWPPQSWIRNFVLVTLVYYGVGAIWSYYIYFCFGHRLFRPGGIPTLPDVVEQMKVGGVAGEKTVGTPTARGDCSGLCGSRRSPRPICCSPSMPEFTKVPTVLPALPTSTRPADSQGAPHPHARPPTRLRSEPSRPALQPAPSCPTPWQVSTLSMPLYSLLPALTEYAAEQGWTMAYARWELQAGVGGVGWGACSDFSLRRLNAAIPAAARPPWQRSPLVCHSAPGTLAAPCRLLSPAFLLECGPSAWHESPPHPVLCSRRPLKPRPRCATRLPPRRVSDVGLPAYIGFFALYMLCVEFAVYW